MLPANLLGKKLKAAPQEQRKRPEEAHDFTREGATLRSVSCRDCPVSTLRPLRCGRDWE